MLSLLRHTSLRLTLKAELLLVGVPAACPAACCACLSRKGLPSVLLPICEFAVVDPEGCVGAGGGKPAAVVEGTVRAGVVPNNSSNGSGCMD